MRGAQAKFNMSLQYTSPEVRSKAVKKAKNECTKTNKIALDALEAVYQDIAEHDQASHQKVVGELEDLKTKHEKLQNVYEHMERNFVAMTLKQGVGHVKKEDNSIDQEADPSQPGSATHEADLNEALKRENQGLKQTVTSIAKERDDAKELAESRQNEIDHLKIIIDAYRKRTSNAKEKVKVEAGNEGEGGTSNPVADETATTLNEHGTKRKAGEMELDGGHES